MNLLTAFKNIPYYVGEAGVFSKRFSGHDRLFKTGQRTFFRPPFIEEALDKSHNGFVRQWEAVIRKSDDERARYLYIPGGVDLSIANESYFFKCKSVKRLIWKFASTKDERRSLERRIQDDLKSYYSLLVGHDVNLRIPRWRSSLYGAHSTTRLGKPILYSISPHQRADSSSQFFGKLESIMF